MNNIYLFVYGSLRQDEERDITKLYPSVTFVQTAYVSGRLYDLGSYPGLILDAQGYLVKGEVYLIDDKVLVDLDELEGYQVDEPTTCYYFRRTVSLMIDKVEISCYLYEANPQQYSLEKEILSGDFKQQR